MTGILRDGLADAAHGLRQMRKNPLLGLVCVILLAIGIGSATAVFTILYDAILKPLPYRDAGQLVYVHNEFPRSQLSLTAASGPDYADLSAHHELFSESAAYYFNDFTLTGAGTAQHVDAVNASATLFPVLGVPPELGRTFMPEEDRYGAGKVVILSDALWRSDFGSDRKVIGRAIELDGVAYRIIGVMPAYFNFPHLATQMWVPLALKPTRLAPGERGDKWLQMLSRLAPGVSPQRANAMLASLSRGYAALYPSDYPLNTGWHFSCQPLQEQRTSGVRSWLVLAFAAVFCVLLIACVNVSGLLLVRATMRKSEWAVRAALGASPARLARQILAETGTLVLIGCAAGILLADVLVQLSNRFGPLHNSKIEPWTFLFAVGACALATILAALLPATLSRAPLEQILRAGGPRSTSAKSTWRSLMIAGQIGLAIALLFAATALSRSFIKLLEVPPGFSPEHVWTGLIQLPERNSTDESASARFNSATFFLDLARRVSAFPGMESASAGAILPFSNAGWFADLYFPGRVQTAVRPAAAYNVVLPGYIDAMKIPLLEGRPFTEHDNGSAPWVAMIDSTFAQQYFPGEDPVGKLVANNGARNRPYRIVGVIGDVAARDLAEKHRPEIYIPALQHPDSAMYVVARSRGKEDITSSVRAALHEMAPDVALFDVEIMPARIAGSVKLRRFVSGLLDAFALVALLLASLGLYGMLAHMVQSRRREIAIRMALGAAKREVFLLIVRQGVSAALIGLAFGAALCFAASRFVQSFLFGIEPLDSWTIAAAIAGFVLLAAIAAGLPAINAARTDLLESLHEE